MVPFLTIKTIFLSSKKAAWCKLKYREHSNRPMNQWSQKKKNTEFLGVWMFCVIFLFLSFITAFQLLPYSFYNLYNASAQMTPQTAFPKIMFFFFLFLFFKLHELLHWMMSLFPTRSPLETKEFAPRGANYFLSELRSPFSSVD